MNRKAFLGFIYRFILYGKKPVLLISVFLLWGIRAYSEENIPFRFAFHNFLQNSLHAFTYNRGLNFGIAVAGTYGLAESGLDWKYNRLAYNNQALAHLGFPALYTGYITPIVLPLGFYLLGRNTMNEKLQVTGLALIQTTIISLMFTSVMKGITGRISPGIVDVLDHNRNFRNTDYSRDFDWGFGRRGFIAGWPSAHTTIAFATAAVISEMYHDRTWVKIGAFSYAAFIGIGVSLCVHWSSEVFAGALIGYAIGKTVSHNFNHRTRNNTQNPVKFYLVPNGIHIGISI
jgi:membrane-associated phospholipid phosphatase